MNAIFPPHTDARHAPAPWSPLRPTQRDANAIIEADLAAAYKAREILTRAWAELGALTFVTGYPVEGYDYRSALDLIADLTPRCDAIMAASIEADAGELVF